MKTISRRGKQGKINTHSYIELNSRGSKASKDPPWFLGSKLNTQQRVKVFLDNKKKSITILW